MKKRILIAASTLLIGLLAYYYSPVKKDSTVSAYDKVPGTHPAYAEQFKIMKQDINGTIPVDPFLSWAKQDKLMKKGADFIESVQEVGPDHIGGRTRALMIDADNNNRLYAGGVSGGLWISNDKGATWIEQNSDAPTLSITAIIQNPFNSNDIYYTVGESAANSAGIQSNGFYISRDKGENFEYIQPKGNQPFTNTWDIDHSKTDSNTIYIGTHTAGVSMSVTDGDSFYRLPGSAGKVHDVDAYSDSTVWYTRERSGVWVYDERTKKSTQLRGGLPTGGFTRVLVERSPSNLDVAYAAFAATSSSMHSVYKTSDGGKSWTKLTDPPQFFNFEWYCLTLGVHPADTNFVVLAGQHPAFSKDGGQTWERLSRSHADYHSLAFWGTGNEFLVGNDGGVHIYDKNTAGNKFIDINKGYSVTQFYAGGFGPGPSDMIIGGTQDNGTHVTKFGNPVFDKPYGGDGAYCAISQQSNVAYLSTQNGYIRRTDTTFEKTSAIFNNLRPLVSSTNDFWFINPFEINPIDGDQIYFPTERNLYVSIDQGDNWSKISNRTPSFAYSVGITKDFDPTVYLGGAAGLLWRIDSATQAVAGNHYDLRKLAPSTVKTSFIGNVEIDPIDETTIYLALNNYGNGDKVWKVENADQDTPVFTSIAGNLPAGLPVNWLEVNDKNTDEIMAATDFGLYVTDDGGEVWEKVDAIPNVAIPQIRFKEENGKLFVFTHGRGIWMVQLKRDNAGINEEEVVLEKELNVYPNPSQDFIQFPIKNISKTRLFDISGKQHQVILGENGNVDVRSLKKGTYYITTEDQGVKATGKFIKL